MDLYIRKAQIGDLEIVQTLNLKLFEKEYKEYDNLLDLKWTFWNSWTTYFKDRIIWDDWCTFVVEIDNIIVWYLCWWICTWELYRMLPVCAELENTFILETYRWKWLWTMLFRAFIERCKIKNVKKIRVEASANNDLTIGFYRKNNFKDYSLKLEANI